MESKAQQLGMYGFVIERTMKKIRQNLQRRFNEMQADITVDQWVILDLLQQKDGLSQNQIASETHKDPPTVTRIIDLLCKKELLVREENKADRRRFSIKLTPTGRSKIREVYPMVQEVRAQGWKGLSLTDYNKLIAVLDQIYTNLEQ